MRYGQIEKIVLWLLRGYKVVVITPGDKPKGAELGNVYIDEAAGIMTSFYSKEFNETKTTSTKT